MPQKKTKAGSKYTIDEKRFTWFPADDNDERGNLEPIVIPLRLKLRVIRGMVGDITPDVMFTILDKIVPDQAEALDDMDLIDFQEMFTTWQNEYQRLSGATLGE